MSETLLGRQGPPIGGAKCGGGHHFDHARQWRIPPRPTLFARRDLRWHGTSPGPIRHAAKPPVRRVHCHPDVNAHARRRGYRKAQSGQLFLLNTPSTNIFAASVRSASTLPRLLTSMSVRDLSQGPDHSWLWRAPSSTERAGRFQLLVNLDVFCGGCRIDGRVIPN